MNLNILEKRKLIKKYWIWKGTNGQKADKLTVGQVLAIYSKYEDDIQLMFDIEDMEELYYGEGHSLSSAKDPWTAKERADYEFEEAI